MPEIKKINNNFKFLIVGSGPEMNKLKIIIKNMKLENDVFMTGQVGQTEVYKYYLAADIFVKNSSYEGLSHILIDAMYYGKPIITTDIGGNRELIADDYNGLLVPCNNREQWLAAITRLWDDDELIKRLTANSVAKMNVFNFSHMMEETLKILKIVDGK
jgi:glycosyltransferase involved in cell wall biosynthesis